MTCPRSHPVCAVDQGGRQRRPILVDVISRDTDLHLRFPAAASGQIDALVSLLAQTMNLPEFERRALLSGGSKKGTGTDRGPW